MGMLPYEQARPLYDVAKTFEWDKWRVEIPFIPLNPDWLFKPVPPFGVGVARFHVRHKDHPETFVSIYLDCYDQAGCVGSPYWEIHPIDGDCARYMMSEVDDLVKGIQQSLDEQIAEYTTRPAADGGNNG
jgi:hypothetical protein